MEDGKKVNMLTCLTQMLGDRLGGYFVTNCNYLKITPLLINNA